MRGLRQCKSLSAESTVLYVTRQLLHKIQALEGRPAAHKGNSVVSFISSMTKLAEISDTGTRAIKRL